MPGKPKKAQREKDLTGRYLSGRLDEDRVDKQERFSDRSAHAEQNRILKTSAMRAEAATEAGDLETLPAGEVVQVFSLFSEVQHEGRTILCVVRKTLTKISDTAVIVGDMVRFREDAYAAANAAAELKLNPDAPGKPLQGVIEAILPRKTVLSRSDSFKGTGQHPIVANAERMVIVASVVDPTVKWGLIDRMIVAAQGGGLEPIICLNKIDLAESTKQAAKEMAFAQEALAHYVKLGIGILQASITQSDTLDALRDLLRGRTTVLAGHSGVGKSSLIRAIQPQLDLRIGEISGYTGKGRHTTTSARRYVLDIGGTVIDTPGVKLFGLWGVTRDNLPDFFPDLRDGTAPDWRRTSYERIAASVPV